MSIQWKSDDVKGPHRFLNRVWNLCHEHAAACDVETMNKGSSDDKKKLVSIEHTAIQQVRTYVCMAL